MNVQMLIDSVVRQTTVLIAQLATSGGVRAPLAHVANQVFLDLATELEAQGVSRKVSADMFGIALRSYQRKIRRLNESSTFRGRSLWEAVLSFVPSDRALTQAEILKRFSADDPVLVRGVLNDLSDNGLVFRTGSGANVCFRAIATGEHIDDASQSNGVDELVWAIIFREGPLSRTELVQRAPSAKNVLDEALRRLNAAQRIETTDPDGPDPKYRATHFIIPLGAAQGWEAAVFDHLQAVIKTITSKLRRASERARPEQTGGSTYSLRIWPGHPHEEAVTSALTEFRKRFSDLRQQVSAFNAEHGIPTRHVEVTCYAGQCVTEIGTDDDVDAEAG